MWTEMALDGRERPELTAQDVRDVYAFLYSVRYFEPSGDVERGRRVFAEKQCHRCHALVRVDGGGIGPAVPDWPSLTDPVLFLEAMWNHGAAMREETQADRIPWPALTVRELADLLAYVYNLPDRPPRLGRLALGSPAAGMRLFDDLGCIRCHSVLETDADRIALAPAAGTARTITDLAVAMWNHQPVMQEWANETGMEVPNLERGQMGQLLSYLMEEGFLDKQGNEKRGARVFETRGCQGCHKGEMDFPARDWRATDLVAAVWMHGPSMRERMAKEGVRWPVLSEADMADLIAWLNIRK
jgi:cytochrome c2